MLNLFLAVISINFTETKDREMAKILAEQEMNRKVSTDAIGKNN